MSISENIISVRGRIAAAAAASGRRPEDITLVGAAKTKPAALIREAVAAGLTVIGENHVQEIRQKGPLGAYEGARVHLIGHLQKNKVKYVAGKVDLIESVDSAELLELISAKAAQLGAVQDVLLEVNIAGELSKTGAPPEALPGLLRAAGALPAVRVRGLMSVPPISAEKGANRPYFARMYKLFVDIDKEKYDNVSMDFLSMGMSGDFEDAIHEGSNMIRVGRAIFGARAYPAKIQED